MEQRIGNRATTALLQGAATASGMVSVDAALDLQRRAGNLASMTVMSATTASRPSPAGAILTAQREAVGATMPNSAAPPAGTGAATAGPADVNVGFNPMDITHKLLIAIDQKQIDINKMKRHVDFDAVVGAVRDLTAVQARQVMDLYLEHEKRTLYNDLFGGGESGFPTDLSYDQLQRIDALMSGTRAVGGSAHEAQSVAAHKLQGDAAELHALLHGDLENREIERVMALLRRSSEANERLIGAYKDVTFSDLKTDLVLRGLYLPRTMALLAGNPVAADSLAVHAQRARIVEIDAVLNVLKERASGVFGDVYAAVQMGQLRKERARIVEEIEQRVRSVTGETREEALAAHQTGDQADAAAKARAAAVIGDLGELAMTLGGTDAAMIRAEAAVDPATTLAAQLKKLADSDDLTAEKLAAALRGLRDEAEAQAGRQLPEGGHDERAELAETIARSYFTKLRTTYDQLAAGGKGFDQLLADTGKSGDARLNKALWEGQGWLEDLDELDIALSGDRKDMAAVDRVLRNKSADDIVQIKLAYWKRTGKSLSAELFGDAPTRAGGENPEVMGRYLLEQGKASGTERLNLEDYMQRPNHEGGIEEVLYISARAQREYEYTIENRGATGWLRDKWGNEEKELLDETITKVRQLFATYLAGVGWTPGSILNPTWSQTRQAHDILQEMRLARATIRGDRAAYEKATAELRATFEAIASFALQVALTVVLGPVAELALLGEIGEGASIALRAAKLAQEAAVGTASTIGANLAVYGNDYSLSMLKADLLGGMGGALGPAAVNRMVGPYAKALEKKLGPKVSAEILGAARDFAGMETGALAQGEFADLSPEAFAKARLARGLTEKLKIDVKPARDESSGARVESETPGGTAGQGAAPASTEAPTGTAGPEVEPAAPEAAVPESKAKTAEPAKGTEAAQPEAARPRSPGEEFGPERTQVGAVPEGFVQQATDPGHPVDAFKLYRKLIAADPYREVGLLYNHALDQWAVVQGGENSLPTLREACERLGWNEHDAVLDRHSHPIGPEGRTPTHDLLPSGRLADLEVIFRDAHKSPGQWHVIDVTMAGGGTDRVSVVYSPETRQWTVDYPTPGQRGSRSRWSFSSIEGYHRWFKSIFGYEPSNVTGPAGTPPAPTAPGSGRAKVTTDGDRTTIEMPADFENEVFTIRRVNDATIEVEGVEIPRAASFKRVRSALINEVGMDGVLADGLLRELATHGVLDLTKTKGLLVQYAHVTGDPVAFLEHLMSQGEGLRAAVMRPVPEDIRNTLVDIGQTPSGEQRPVLSNVAQVFAPLPLEQWTERPLQKGPEAELTRIQESVFIGEGQPSVITFGIIATDATGTVVDIVRTSRFLTGDAQFMELMKKQGWKVNEEAIAEARRKRAELATAR